MKAWLQGATLLLAVCMFESKAETNAAIGGPNQPQNARPVTYHLKIAQYGDTFDKTPEYVFVVGEVAYRSLEQLEKAITRFSKGSILQRAKLALGEGVQVS